MYGKIARKVRWLILTLRGAHVSYRATIHGWDLVSGDAQTISIGSGCCFSKYARLVIGSYEGVPGILTIGAGTFINDFTIIDCIRSITIGRQVQIGPNSYIGDFDHATALSTGSEIDRYGTVEPVVIEDHVWIGAGVVVLRGVTIGAGSIIGAGSVVTSDIPARSVVVGVPARVVKLRPG